MTIHEDDRRILIDWASGNFRSAKVIRMKKTVAVGGHLHENKDEEFLLLEGRILEINIDNYVKCGIKAPYYFAVKRGIYHSFICEEGSIILCVSTEPYNEKDEIK